MESSNFKSSDGGYSGGVNNDNNAIKRICGKVLKYNNHIKVTKVYLVILVTIVISSQTIITLAEEDNTSGKLEETLQNLKEIYNSANLSTNGSSEGDDEEIRSAGVSFPTWDDIRESFRKFQAQLNKLRSGSDSKNSNSSIPYSTTGNPSQSRSSGSGVSSNPQFRPFPWGPNSKEIGGRYVTPSTTSSSGIFFGNKPSNSNSNYNYVYKYTPPNSASELQQHTTTTIYIICICLIIMVVGSVMFVCVSKCQDSPDAGGVNGGGGGSSSRPRRRISNGNTNSAIRNSNVSVSTISIAMPPSGDNSSAGGSSLRSPDSPKITYDLPPSYDSLFPNGKQ